MKKLFFFLSTILFIITIYSCNSNEPDSFLKNTTTRSKIISTLLKNSDYTNELMDSMIKQMNNTEMMHKMMGGDKMMQMMKGDTSMRNSMMEQMMKMANEDSMMCSRMMDKMMSQPNISKQLQTMQKKFEQSREKVKHLQHHK